MCNYKDLIKLKELNSVCIIGHMDPDPDALASMVVMRDFLINKMDVKNVYLMCDFSNDLSYEMKEILGDIEINYNLSNCNCAIMMDSPNIQRLGKFANLFEGANMKIVIDHHATNCLNGDINIVEICSSTCEIVYSICSCYSFELNDENKGKLYAGIITDTNNFTVGEISSRTFNICADLIKNIDKNSIYKAFLAKNTLKSMKILSLAIQNINSYCDNQIIITHISHEEANQHNITTNDLCGIVNEITTINTAKLICFIEPREDKYYASMRAKDNYDVSTVAKNNGGGGHIGAAAFLSNLDWKDIENNLVTEFKKQL